MNKNQLDQDNRQQVRDAILKKKRHQGNKTTKKKNSNPISSFGSFAKKGSSAGFGDMFKRSDSSHKTTAPKNLEVVNEEDRYDGEFPHLPSAADLVGKGKESGVNGDAGLNKIDSETCLEAVGLPFFLSCYTQKPWKAIFFILMASLPNIVFFLPERFLPCSEVV